MRQTDGHRYPGAVQSASVHGGYSPGPYSAAALAYFKSCLDAGTYARLARKERWDEHPYVAARLFLRDDQWLKYVWIEQHGTLDGFAEAL